MPGFTRISLRALEELGGPRIILAAIPGGARALADRAGVSQSRVSQILRQDPLPWEWAQLIAEMIPCPEWEVYAQLGQRVSDVVTPKIEAVSSSTDRGEVHARAADRDKA
jgi:hypothetical protein